MIKVQLDASNTLIIAEALGLSEKKYAATKNRSDGFNRVYRKVEFLHDLFSNLNVSPDPYEITISSAGMQKGGENGK